MKNTLPTKNRILWADAAKGIGIVLVVFGHFIFNYNDAVRNFIYSFHMPLFFIISGFLFKKRELSVTIKRVIKKFVIPTYCFALLDVLICAYNHHDRMGESIGREDLLNTIFVTGGITHQSLIINDPIWFFMALAIITVLQTIICDNKKLKVPLFLLVIIALAVKQFFYKDVSLNLGWYINWTYCFIFFELGYYLKSFDINAVFKKKWLTYIAIIVELALLVLINKYNGFVLVAAFHFEKSLILAIIAGLIGSNIVLFISTKIHATIVGKFLSFLGKNSVFIMVTHYYFWLFLPLQDFWRAVLRTIIFIIAEAIVIYIYTLIKPKITKR